MSGETCEAIPLTVVMAGNARDVIRVCCETRAALEETASEKKRSGDDTFYS